jgi:hypothetical protein
MQYTEFLTYFNLLGSKYFPHHFVSSRQLTIYILFLKQETNFYSHIT